jgi:tetratricopeptide (TPR) repeat protein
MLLLIGLISGHLADWMNVLDGIGRPPGADLSAWSRRVELWRNALFCVRDYPLSGAGLGAFVHVAPLNYPFLESLPDSLMAIVPNLWLHAGVDLGILGLVAFTWLTIVVVLMGWKIRLRRRGDRILLTGFWLGLLAWMGHGLLAGVWLAQPLGILVWVVIGVLLSGWLSEGEEPEPLRSRRGLLQVVWVLGGLGLAVIVGWLLLSPVLFLNQGAQRLDYALINHSIATDERTRLLKDAQRLLGQVGDLPGAIRRQAVLEYELGSDEQAAVAFRQDPGAEPYLFSRGRWLLASGRKTEAEHLLGVAVEAVSVSPRLACLRARVDSERGDPFGALDNYRRGLDLSATFDAEPEALIECHDGFARLAESLGWWGEAAGSLAQAAELDPRNLDFQRRYAWALFTATGELGESVAVLEGALRLEADSVPMMMTLIDIYLAAERPQKAVEWSQNAIDVDSSNAGCWLRLAKAYAALEEFEQARSALAETLRLDPNLPEAIDLQTEWEMP